MLENADVGKKRLTMTTGSFNFLFENLVGTAAHAVVLLHPPFSR
jgi:hypothetical protein